LFSLFGLLIAFTFSGSASRFDSRRQLLAEEINDIGTAYLRLDLLPAGVQPALHGLFRDYVDSRLAVYRKLPELDAAKAELARSEKIQGEIWTRAVAATADSGADADASRLVLPSLNAMIDITNTRVMAARIILRRLRMSSCLWWDWLAHCWRATAWPRANTGAGFIFSDSPSSWARACLLSSIWNTRAWAL